MRRTIDSDSTGWEHTMLVFPTQRHYGAALFLEGAKWHTRRHAEGVPGRSHDISLALLRKAQQQLTNPLRDPDTVVGEVAEAVLELAQKLAKQRQQGAA